MNSGYVKLFSEIIDSSIWNEPHSTRLVWITLLALSDCDGYVRGSIGWLAGKAKVTVNECQIAIAKFLSPDPQSRTPDNEGKRIEALDDGWLILNYLAFRDRLSIDPKAIGTRERVRKHRERYMALRNAKSVTPPDAVYASVSVVASVQDKSPERRGEIELPSWYPLTEEDAVALCAPCGIEEDFIRKTWKKGASRGGLDSKGQAIKRFANYAQTEYGYERQRQSRTNFQSDKPRHVQPDYSKGF